MNIIHIALLVGLALVAVNQRRQKNGLKPHFFSGVIPSPGSFGLLLLALPLFADVEGNSSTNQKWYTFEYKSIKGY